MSDNTNVLAIRVETTEKSNEVKTQLEEGLITHMEYVRWVLFHFQDVSKGDALVALSTLMQYNEVVCNRLETVYEDLDNKKVIDPRLVLKRIINELS